VLKIRSSRPGGRRTSSRVPIAVAGAVALVLAATTVATAIGGAEAGTRSGHRAQGQGLVVDTPYGTVEGTTSNGAQAFLGLPFAAPPVYDRMWKAPVPPASWRGVRDASEQQPACLQFEPTGVKNDQATSLDCLYLDVYRPAHIARGEKLPVMVFYHGGAGTQGSGVLYGGQTMAKRDNVIIVSTNYRLGASGSMALPALDAENPDVGGNFALLDQVEALKWVRKSIGAFGGDKNDVTIFGQSAGSRAVCNLLATPLTAGLFDSAIMESSPCLGGGGSKASAETASEKYAAAVGCPAGPDQLRCLRYAWPATMVQAFGTNRPGAYTGTPTLPQASGTAIAAGNWHKVPVLMGNTRWEQRLQNQQYADITEAEYQQMILDQFGATAGPLVLAKYPASAYEKPFYALAAVRTDNGAGCQMDTNAKLFVSQGVPVYRYEFEDPTSPTLFGFQPEDTDMSSAHSVELAYLFDFTLGDRPLTAKQEKLGHSMQDYWTAFARYGAPRARGEVSWPRYTVAGDQALKLGPQIKVVTGLYDEHNCGFFASLPA
jgi:para-nitrobenzyl esterase